MPVVYKRKKRTVEDIAAADRRDGDDWFCNSVPRVNIHNNNNKIAFVVRLSPPRVSYFTAHSVTRRRRRIVPVLGVYDAMKTYA